VVVVAGHGDQCTEGDERVEKGCIRFVMNNAECRVSSSNVMTSIVEMTNLSHSMFMRKRRELDRVSLVNCATYLYTFSICLCICLSNYQTFQKIPSCDLSYD